MSDDVDTGTEVERDEFITALHAVLDPADLKWIWLTHTDFDHIGSCNGSWPSTRRSA